MTGTLTFYDGTTLLGTGNVSGNTASYSTSALALGGHQITAAYSGDADYASATSSAFQQVIGALGTTTTVLKSSGSPAVVATNVTFTATIASPATGTPSGSVTFYSDATSIGSANLSGSTASLTTKTLAVGTHTITATYSGDANFQTSSAFALLQVITKVATETAVTSSTTQILNEGPATLTATVTTKSGTPTGIVSFSDGSTQVGTGTLNSSGVATLDDYVYPVGAHNITATYLGDDTFAGSTSTTVVINVVLAPYTSSITFTATPTPTSLVSALNPSLVGQSVTFTATLTASGSSKRTAMMNFYDGTTLLGTSALFAGSTNVYTAAYSTASLAAGSHNITAAYAGDANNSASTSAILSQVVNKAATTLTVSSSPNPSVYNTAVTLTANLTAMGPNLPTGSITFNEGIVSLGTGTISAGVATLSISTLAVGAHSISASFSGDASNAAATSAAVVQNVTQASTTVALVSSLNPAGTGQAVTFIATVTPAPPTGSTEIVNFYDGTTLLGAETLSSGKASFTTSSLSIGTHTITAAYSGNINLLGSTSSALLQVVTATVADFTLSGTGPAQGVPPGAQALFTITAASKNGAYNSPVVFSLTGLPAGFTASFAPPSVTPGAAGAATTLTVQVPTVLSSAQSSRLALLAGLLLLPLLRRRVARRIGVAALLFVAGIAMLGTSGCSGGFYGYPPASYTLTITGTSGSIQHNTTVTLPVQ